MPTPPKSASVAVSIDRALELALEHQRAGRLDEAQSILTQVVQARPEHGRAAQLLGQLHRQAGRLDQALHWLGRAAALEPNAPEALVNYATLLNQLGRLDEAIALLRRAAALIPDVPEVHNNLACALRDQGDFPAAFASYRRALALRPTYPRAHSNLISAMDLAGTSLADAQAERRRWHDAQHGAPRFTDWPNPRDPERRLKLGYVSADLRRHALAYAIGPVLTRYDRARFEVTCYASLSQEDDVTARFKAAVDHWRAVGQLADDALAQQVRADGIDILIDLSGHSPGNRLPVFVARPAPVQLSAWGHPTGTGIAEIDALLADPVLIPPRDRRLFAETIVDLPCALCYEAPDYAPAPAPPPMLAAGHVTFGCLNRYVKVTDAALALWSRVLGAVPASRLLLKDTLFSRDDERGRALARLAALGIAPERVVLVGTTDHPTHFATYGAIDVALDPLPQNGGINTLDALWMGVPVVTRLGAMPLARLGGSILTALGLDALIAADDAGYVAIAQRLAGDRDRLAALRTELRARMRATPIANPALYVAAVERAYRDLWRAWCAR